MINPNAFVGEPIQFQGVCKIYPPKVKEVVGNPNLLSLYKLLTYSQEDIEDLFDEKKEEDKDQADKKMPTPLEFILINSYYNKDFRSMIQEAFQIFIKEEVTILFENKLILIGNAEDLVKINDIKKFRYLSEDNFFNFQNLIRESMGNSAIEPPDLNVDPVIRNIKKKNRRRERLKAKNSNKKGISLTTTLGAICCMGLGITPLNIGEMSYASTNVIVTLYQQKEKYQTDIDSLMAGADPKKVHPKYWIREESNYVEVKI